MNRRPIRDNAHELAKLIGQTIRADEVEDAAVVEPMVQLSLTLVISLPHLTLDEKLREAADAREYPHGSNQ